MHGFPNHNLASLRAMVLVYRVCGFRFNNLNARKKVDARSCCLLLGTCGVSIALCTTTNAGTSFLPKRGTSWVSRSQPHQPVPCEVASISALHPENGNCRIYSLRCLMLPCVCVPCGSDVLESVRLVLVCTKDATNDSGKVSGALLQVLATDSSLISVCVVPAPQCAQQVSLLPERAVLVVLDLVRALFAPSVLFFTSKLCASCESTARLRN